MICLEIVNGSALYINEDYIETIEVNSDTVVRIHGGTIYVVKQRPEEIMRQIVAWNHSLREHVSDQGSEVAGVAAPSALTTSP